MGFKGMECNGAGVGRKGVWRSWNFLSKHSRPQPRKYLLGERDRQELTLAKVTSVWPAQTHRARASGLGKKSDDENEYLVSIFSVPGTVWSVHELTCSTG